MTNRRTFLATLMALPAAAVAALRKTPRTTTAQVAKFPVGIPSCARVNNLRSNVSWTSSRSLEAHWKTTFEMPTDPPMHFHTVSASQLRVGDVLVIDDPVKDHPMNEEQRSKVLAYYRPITTYSAL